MTSARGVFKVVSCRGYPNCSSVPSYNPRNRKDSVKSLVIKELGAEMKSVARKFRKVLRAW